MESYLDWPIVTAENCFGVIRDMGIQPLREVKGDQLLVDYLEDASLREMNDYEKYAPKSYVSKYENPQNLKTFDGFRTIFPPVAVVFALINDMVLVTAEWKHGNEKITIVPPAGGASNEEEFGLSTLAETMAATAMREWEEETGTKLKSVIPLGSEQGVFSAVRNTNVSYHLFLGELLPVFDRGKTKFDDNENLVTVLFPLNEWLKLLESPELWNQNKDFGMEMCAHSITYAALRKLKRLEMKY